MASLEGFYMVETYCQDGNFGLLCEALLGMRPLTKFMWQEQEFFNNNNSVLNNDVIAALCQRHGQSLKDLYINLSETDGEALVTEESFEGIMTSCPILRRLVIRGRSLDAIRMWEIVSLNKELKALSLATRAVEGAFDAALYGSKLSRILASPPFCSVEYLHLDVYLPHLTNGCDRSDYENLKRRATECIEAGAAVLGIDETSRRRVVSINESYLSF